MRESQETTRSVTSAATIVDEIGLGEGGELEHGVGVDRVGFAHLPHAEAAEIDDLVLVDDGDGEARHAAIGNGRLRELLEFGDRGEHLVLRRRLGPRASASHRCHQAQHQCAKEDGHV
jgi:hypothetical protein